MPKYIDATKLDDSKLQERFEQAFQEAIDNRDNDLKVVDFDVSIVRDAVRNVAIQVTIYGLAEVPTQEQFCDVKTKKVIKGGEKFEFEVDGRGTVGFVFNGIDRKNSNDYVVNYKPL